MKKGLIMKNIILALLFISSLLFSKSMHSMFQSVPIQKAQLLQKGEDKMHCANCGMKLPKFYKTNHVAVVDGKVKQYCSIHCLAEDIINGKNPTNMRVVDNSTLKFIPVEKAYYVVGSKKPATMSSVSKYAFGNKSDAEKFAKKFGGKVMDFTQALEIAKKDFK